MKYRYAVIIQKSERGIHQTVREQYSGSNWKLVGVLPDYPKCWIGVLKTPDTSRDYRTHNSQNSYRTRGGGAKAPPLHLVHRRRMKNNV